MFCFLYLIKERACLIDGDIQRLIMHRSFPVGSMLYACILLDKDQAMVTEWTFDASHVRYLAVIYYFFAEALYFVLNNNFFNFNDRIFRQVKGVAIGSPIGSSYANNFIFSLLLIDFFCLTIF